RTATKVMSVIQHPTSNIQDPSPHCSGFAVLIGRPGVGKSTLVNRLVGQKVAITAAVPQITRTRLSGILTLPHAQIVFVDTPGLHRPRHRLGEWMVEQSVRALRDADVVLLVLDAGDGVTPEDRAAIARLGGVRAPALAVLNKIDRLPPGEMGARRAQEDAHREGRPDAAGHRAAGTWGHRDPAALPHLPGPLGQDVQRVARTGRTH